MLVEKAENEFKLFIAQNGFALESLLVESATTLMLAFYKSVRAENCDLVNDGDMLLFEWGTYDWGDGEKFYYSLTRQFICPIASEDDDEPEDGVYQLPLKLKFSPTNELKSLKSGNKWCNRPEDLDEFELFIEGARATQMLKSATPNEVELSFYQT